MAEDETKTNEQDEQPKDETEPKADETPKDEAKPKAKTYTKEEVEAMIQDRLDREKKAAEKRAGIEKLEGEERLKAQFDLDRETLTKERDEAKQALRVANATVELTQAGLKPEFAPYVIGETDEQTAENIKNLSELVRSQVQAEVSSRMKRGAPKVPGDAPAAEDKKMMDAIYAAAGLKPRA